MVRVLLGPALLAFTVSVVALAKTAPPAQPFQRIDGCAYKPQRWNDGDSFHVVLPDQKELIFRLYFVDAPEEERVYADRIVEQAAYFGISNDAAVEVGREASEFTKKTLAKPFTIYTRWRRALGRSAVWRYYAIVITAEGKDLNELLVSAGLARIYGTRTPLPDDRDSREYLAHMYRTGIRSKGCETRRWGQSEPVKYWEIIADRLHAEGWSYGIAEHLHQARISFLRRCTPRWKTIHR